jgi:hypothetical protein
MVLLEQLKKQITNKNPIHLLGILFYYADNPRKYEIISVWVKIFLSRDFRRVETKIFVFVFSRKFRANLFALFAKKPYENLRK